MSPTDFFLQAKAAGAVPPGAQFTAAFAFGDGAAQADELAALARAGIKTATSSNLAGYGPTEALPAAGDYAVVLDGHQQPVAVLFTEAVAVVPFNAVTAEHAYLEGEGARQLASWRAAHQAFFTAEAHTEGRSFDSAAAEVVLEQFRCVYPQTD